LPTGFTIIKISSLLSMGQNKLECFSDAFFSGLCLRLEGAG